MRNHTATTQVQAEITIDGTPANPAQAAILVSAALYGTTPIRRGTIEVEDAEFGLYLIPADIDIDLDRDWDIEWTHPEFGPVRIYIPGI